MESIIIFACLLLGLILCAYLGSWTLYEGMESGTVTTYNGPNGETAVINTDSNTIVVTNKDSTVTTYSVDSTDKNLYVGPNGGTATVTTTSNGPSSIRVVGPNGESAVVFTTATGTTTVNKTTTTTGATNYDNYNHYNGSSYASIYYGPNGGTARINKTDTSDTIVITNKNGTTETYTASAGASVYYGPNGGSIKIITDANGKSAIELTSSNGSKIVYTENNTYTYNNNTNDVDVYDNPNTHTYPGDNVSTVTGPTGNTAVTGPNGNTAVVDDPEVYYASLPPGIPRNQIPAGDEDLYILKSQVVPPVCPRCPDVISSGNTVAESKVPPCPPCARCPEPQFECTKTFTGNSINPDYAPMPVLNDFSTFGM